MMKSLIIALSASGFIAQAATPLPPLILQPGPKYADAARMFQGIPATEHEGKLYIICTHSKEDCALSIIPVSALAAR